MDFSFTPIDFAPTILRAIVGHRGIEIARRHWAPFLHLLRTIEPFARVAADFLGQMHNVDEFVSLPAQFVGHHGGLRRICGDDRNPDAFPLHCFDQ
jgi:hypothetical protein